MFRKKIIKSNFKDVNKILCVSLSNIGDVILTFPVIDILKESFPNAEVSVMTGNKAKSLFDNNPNIENVFIYDKSQSLLNIYKWLKEIKLNNFDLVVDLRNTFIPILFAPKYRTSFIDFYPKKDHMKLKHLQRLKTVLDYSLESKSLYCIYVDDKDEKMVDKLLSDAGFKDKKIVVVAPSAADENKRWSAEKFAELSDYLIEKNDVNIIFVGDNYDKKNVDEIQERMRNKTLNLSGKLSLVQLACLYKRCFFAFGNDSSPMHLASYLNVPVFGIFGPTNPLKYGPWSDNSYYIKNVVKCLKCDDSRVLTRHTCMDSISVDDVIKNMIINDTVKFGVN